MIYCIYDFVMSPLTGALGFTFGVFLPCWELFRYRRHCCNGSGTWCDIYTLYVQVYTVTTVRWGGSCSAIGTWAIYKSERRSEYRAGTSTRVLKIREKHYQWPHHYGPATVDNYNTIHMEILTSIYSRTLSFFLCVRYHSPLSEILIEISSL